MHCLSAVRPPDGAAWLTHDNGPSTNPQKQMQVEDGPATHQGALGEGGGEAIQTRTRSALMQPVTPHRQHGGAAHHGLTQGLSKDTAFE